MQIGRPLTFCYDLFKWNVLFNGESVDVRREGDGAQVSEESLANHQNQPQPENIINLIIIIIIQLRTSLWSLSL